MTLEQTNTVCGLIFSTMESNPESWSVKAPTLLVATPQIKRARPERQGLAEAASRMPEAGRSRSGSAHDGATGQDWALERPEPLFPVWDIPTAQLGRDMIASGVKAKITCVDPSRLPKSFAGRDYDLPLLQARPSDIDPCGENGEFHTFVSDAPVFSRPIAVRAGEVVERDGFVLADVLPQ